MNSWRILVGDVRERLATLPAGCARTCVTSPPYWGLRDYGVAGQLGLERTPEAYVAAMVGVFREVRRVLADDGTVWLNLGDSYAGSWGNQGRKEERGTQRPINGGMLTPVTDGRYPDKGSNTGAVPPGLKPKDLVGIPWLVAFALRADGWYLRSDIIWSKPNPMPESVTDRPTKAHEYIFLLSKAKSYYYDAKAIAEDVAESQIGRVRSDPIGGKSWPGRQQHSAGGVYRLPVSDLRDGPVFDVQHNGLPTDATEGAFLKLRGDERLDCGQSGLGVVGVQSAEFDGDVEVCSEAGEGLVCHDQRIQPVVSNVKRNRRSVWHVSTQPYPEAHFATFPEDLIEPCILAGSAFGDTVLDPFTGSGTTGAVAIRHQRNFIGCELNPAYVELARKRIGSVAPMFAQEVA